MNKNKFEQYELMDVREVAELIRIGKTTIYKLLDANNTMYDPTFPRQIKIGHKSFWSRSEICTWIESRMAARHSISTYAVDAHFGD